MSNPRELSKIFTADTIVTTHSELLTTAAAASANAMTEAMSYVDSELSYIDLTSTIVTASTAALSAANSNTTSVVNALTTTDIEEGINLYFSNQRAIDAGSATYLSITGGSVIGGLTISGNLSVAGSTTYLNATNLNVTDSIINLSVEQQQDDVIDQGFTASYGQTGDNDQTHKHRGLVYDKSDSKWKLFSNVSASSIGTTIDFDGSNSDTLVVNSLEGNVIGNLTGTSSSANYVPYTGVVGLDTTYLTQSNASIIYLAQSSASALYEPDIPYVSASPSTPSAGTLWIDSTNSAAPALKVYNGTTWIAVSGAASESGFHPFFGAY